MQFKVQGVDQVLATLSGLASEFPEAAARALNTTARRSATRVRRQLASEIGLPQREISNRIKHFKANRKTLKASVWVGARAGIPLAQVSGARSTLGGELRAGRVRVKTFRARMPSGHVGQFTRKPGSAHVPGKGTRRGGPRPDGQRTELPIEEPRVRIGARARPILERVTRDQMTTFYPGELRRLTRLAIERQRRRRR